MLLQNFIPDLFGELLGLHRAGVFIATGGFYLINYVTCEVNWLHLILIRGFTAKGGEYVCTQNFSDVYL